MARDYYDHELWTERDALERWENEGGRPWNNHDSIADAVGKKHLWHVGQVKSIAGLGKLDRFSRMRLFATSNSGRSSKEEAVGMDNERSQSYLFS